MTKTDLQSGCIHRSALSQAGDTTWSLYEQTVVETMEMNEVTKET